MATAVLCLALLASLIATRHRTSPSDMHPARSAAAEIVASVDRRASHNHRYLAEVVAKTPLVVGARQSWTVQLTRHDHRRVADARVTVQSWAPEIRERSPISTSVRYVGGGRYRVDGIYFPRAGWWNVALAIDAATGIDSVAFNVVLPDVAVARR